MYLDTTQHSGIHAPLTPLRTYYQKGLAVDKMLNQCSVDRWRPTCPSYIPVHFPLTPSHISGATTADAEADSVLVLHTHLNLAATGGCGCGRCVGVRAGVPGWNLCRVGASMAKTCNKAKLRPFVHLSFPLTQLPSSSLLLPPLPTCPSPSLSPFPCTHPLGRERSWRSGELRCYLHFPRIRKCP